MSSMHNLPYKSDPANTWASTPYLPFMSQSTYQPNTKYPIAQVTAIPVPWKSAKENNPVATEE